MKLTTAQQKDLETIRFFIPPQMKLLEITEEDIENFFDFSDHGIRRGDEHIPQKMDGYHALLQGKRWRGIHIHEMYEPGVLDGSMPYFVLLQEIVFYKGLKKFFAHFLRRRDYSLKPAFPRVVVDFLKMDNDVLSHPHVRVK